MPAQRHPSSYRDPSGYILVQDGRVYRQVNRSYRADYELLKESGLYERLVREQLLLPHREREGALTGDANAWLTLEPEQLEFVSYPWEWCFAQLRDAALLTLRILRLALDHGMVLKDATPFNVQLHQGRLVFIDTLSFERYDATKPWIAYRQFCESFLAPLALMHYAAQPLQPMLLGYPDGIPLETAAALLPRRSRWNLHLYLHLHLHARVGQKAAGKTGEAKGVFSEKKLRQIADSLESGIRNLKLEHKGAWSAYYDEAATRNDYLARKQEVIAEWIAGLPQIATALDAGANDGAFAQLLAARGVRTIAADSEHAAITRLYKGLQPGSRMYPLVIDFVHPSAAVGANNTERSAFLDRSRCDLVLALAFIHHLCIGRNLPFEDVAGMFRRLAPRLLIEFVPKSDEKVQFMLQQKPDVYDWYTQEAFVEAFTRHYNVQRKTMLPGGRSLFLLTATDR